MQIEDVDKKSRDVIVTGASGFIGQHLIPLLISNNYHVIAISRNPNKASKFNWYKDVSFIKEDFHKENIQIKFAKGASLIHLAWQDLPNYTSSFHYEENLPASYRFIKSMIDSGVSKVLISGTCFEYGFQSGAISSSNSTNPQNAYALAKDSLRRQLELLSLERPFLLQWARLFYMYGEGQHPKSLLSQLDSAIDNNEKVFNMSRGEQLRDYLPVEDVAKQIFDLFKSNKKGAYNICSGIPISVRSIVEQRIKERRSKIKLNLGYYQYADYEPMAFWGIRDIDK